MLMQIKQRVLEVVDEMTVVASRVDESSRLPSALSLTLSTIRPETNSNDFGGFGIN